jgi:hypothetical protein
MALRTVLATRYVTPLREGGSLPAVVEADDGMYVLKFRGAEGRNRCRVKRPSPVRRMFQVRPPTEKKK